MGYGLTYVIILKLLVIFVLFRHEIQTVNMIITINFAIGQDHISFNVLSFDFYEILSTHAAISHFDYHTTMSLMEFPFAEGKS